MLTWRKSWPLLLLASVDLVEFSMIAHKESRFVFICIPIYLIGIAVLVGSILRLSWTGPSPSGSGIRVAAFGLASSVVLVSLAGLCYVLPLEFRLYHRPPIWRDDTAQAYLKLSRLDRVTGVIDDSRVPWFETGGYYLLHQPAPIYRADLTPRAMLAVRKSPLEYASHWILPIRTNAPTGYYLAATAGQLAIWQRRRDPNKTLIAPGYSPMAPTHGHIPVAPSVTPRW
jgi:hypothetical protein